MTEGSMLESNFAKLTLAPDAYWDKYANQSVVRLNKAQITTKVREARADGKAYITCHLAKEVSTSEWHYEWRIASYGPNGQMFVLCDKNMPYCKVDELVKKWHDDDCPCCNACAKESEIRFMYPDHFSVK
jgi:hypothetical protein